MTDYGLPEPDHKLLEAHPTVSSGSLPAATTISAARSSTSTVSSELLPRLGAV